MTMTKLTEYISSDVEETALAMEVPLNAVLADTVPVGEPVVITVSAPRIAGGRR